MSDLQLQQVISEATQKVAQQSGTQATPGEASAENVARFESALNGGQTGGNSPAQGTEQARGAERAQGVERANETQQPQGVENTTQAERTSATLQPDAVHGKSAVQEAQEFADGHKQRIDNVKAAMGKGNLTPSELISLHFDVMQVTFGQQLTKTVADETGKGVKTLFNRSS